MDLSTTRRITPEVLFNKMIPARLRACAPLGVRGTCLFRVRGAGEWTVDLGRRRVYRGGVEEPDFALEIGADDLTAIFDGRLPPERAARQLAWHGDPNLLASFGQSLLT